MRYRTEEEAAAWAERDPLLVAPPAPRLDDEEATAAIRAEAEAEMAAGDRVGRGAAGGRRRLDVLDDVYAEGWSR